jgi:hypothetical protein
MTGYGKAAGEIADQIKTWVLANRLRLAEAAAQKKGKDSPVRF